MAQPKKLQLLWYGESIGVLLYAFQLLPSDSPTGRYAFHITVAEFLEELAKTALPHHHILKLSIVVVYYFSCVSVCRVTSSVGGRPVCECG